jgi:Uma2 family endonuclease
VDAKMVQTLVKVITLAEFLLLPETKPASEFIGGQIVQKPMAQGKHSLIQGQLVINIELKLKPQKIARAYPELRCSFGGQSLVPDVAIFTSARIPRDENGDIANTFAIAPDWTIEILSPDQSQTRVIKNILHCLQHGTQMGWLIDPAEQLVFVYASNRATEAFDEATQILPTPEFAEDFHLTIGDLFGWLRE